MAALLLLVQAQTETRPCSLLLRLVAVKAQGQKRPHQPTTLPRVVLVVVVLSRRLFRRLVLLARRVRAMPVVVTATSGHRRSRQVAVVALVTWEQTRRVTAWRETVDRALLLAFLAQRLLTLAAVALASTPRRAVRHREQGLRAVATVVQALMVQVLQRTQGRAAAAAATVVPAATEVPAS